MPIILPQSHILTLKTPTTNTGFQWVRYIATIRYNITRKVTPPSLSTNIKTALDLNIYVRGDVGEAFMHADRGAGRREAAI